MVTFKRIYGLLLLFFPQDLVSTVALGLDAQAKDKFVVCEHNLRVLKKEECGHKWWTTIGKAYAFYCNKLHVDDLSLLPHRHKRQKTNNKNTKNLSIKLCLETDNDDDVVDDSAADDSAADDSIDYCNSTKNALGNLEDMTEIITERSLDELSSSLQQANNHTTVHKNPQRTAAIINTLSQPHTSNSIHCNSTSVSCSSTATSREQEIAKILIEQSQLSQPLMNILNDIGLLSNNGNIDIDVIPYLDKDDVDSIVACFKKLPGKRLRDLLSQQIPGVC